MLFTHAIIEHLSSNADTIATCSWNSFIGDTVKEKYEDLYTKLVELTNICETKGGQGQEWIVTSPEIAVVLDSSFDSTCVRPTEVTYLGCISNRWKVYADPDIPRDVLIVGKGECDEPYGWAVGNVARLKLMDFCENM